MSDNTISIKDPQMEYAYHFASVIDPIYEEDYLFDEDGKVIVDKKWYNDNSLIEDDIYEDTWIRI